MRHLLLMFSVLFAAGGYAQETDSISKRSDSAKSPVLLKDITISADRLNQRSSVSEIILDKQTIKTNHGLIEDPLRVISTMPGVARGGDLFSPSQIYVRGGAPDENLFLNNNAKIYFPFYFGGQKSIFNSDVIENVELLTGGFSAKYGNTLSSVLNVTTRDGKRDGYAGVASLGFYNSALLVEGPAGKDASFLIAGRRTYLDLMLDESAEFPVPGFGDITYKFSIFADKRNKIMFSGLSGYENMDFLAANPEPGMPDRIKTKGAAHSQSLQWQHTGARIYSKLSLVNTIQRNQAIVSRNVNLKIEGLEKGIREDFEYKLNDKVKLQAGFETYYNDVDFNSTLPRDPREADPTDTTITLAKIIFNEDSWVMGGWLATNVAVSKKFGFNAGLRYDFTDLQSLQTLAPRLSAYYTLTKKTELRVAYSHNYQFPSSEALSKPDALQTPLCIHYIAGVRRQLTKDFSGWIEVYNKEYSRLVTFDTSLNYSNRGLGYARGVELFLHKQKGKISGWISYAYAIAKRRSNLDNKEYYFDFDQRHISNLSVQYNTGRADRKWYIPSLFNAQVRAESGRPYTPVEAAVLTPAGWRQLKGEINSRREDYYLNVNFRVEWRYRISKKLVINSFFDIWNLLNRKNVLGRTFQYGPQYPNNIHIQPYYTTPVLPAGGVRFEFN